MHNSTFFSPQSIAVIGASRDADKIGNVILKNILDSGYKGKLYPVNPNADKILGLKVYDTVADIPAKVDMAVIVIPGKFVDEVLQDCGMKGIKNVVIISAGFGELGEEGFKNEAKIIDTAGKFQINILGPNCLGFINSDLKLNATFAAENSLPGEIVFASQSGAMGTAFLDWALEHKIGLRYFISLGNKVGINENTVLEQLASDPKVKTVLFYLEDFADGRHFFELAGKLSKNKAIIVLKPGQSTSSQHAIASHTGSLAQDDRIVDTALRDSGCIRVKTIEELFELTMLLSWQKIPVNNSVAVITNAGGVGIQTVDDLEGNGLRVIPFSEKLSSSLRKFLPEEANVKNPVDLLGDAQADRYQLALKSVIEDKSIGAILLVLTPQMVTQALQTAKFINEIADKHNKTVLTSFVGGESIFEARKFLIDQKIPHFNYPNDAARALGLIVKWSELIKAGEVKIVKMYKPSKVNSELSKATIGRAIDLPRSQELFRKYDIPLLESKIYLNKAAIKNDISKIKFPLVLKLTHPKLIHKTEFKAVRLDIKDEETLMKEIKELEAAAQKGKLTDFKFEIQPYIRDMLEVIIGVKKDAPQHKVIENKDYLRSKGFGHVMIFGAGGIYTEVYTDIQMALMPVDKETAIKMIDATKVGKIIRGVRGQKFEFDKIIKVITNLSKLVVNNTNINEIDINPLFVTKDEVYAADIKIFAS